MKFKICLLSIIFVSNIVASNRDLSKDDVDEQKIASMRKAECLSRCEQEKDIDVKLCNTIPVNFIHGHVITTHLKHFLCLTKCHMKNNSDSFF